MIHLLVVQICSDCGLVCDDSSENDACQDSSEMWCNYVNVMSVPVFLDDQNVMSWSECGLVRSSEMLRCRTCCGSSECNAVQYCTECSIV
jgi:hypothetical protein